MKNFFCFLAAHIYCLFHWDYHVYHKKRDDKITSVGATNGEKFVYWFYDEGLK